MLPLAWFALTVAAVVGADQGSKVLLRSRLRQNRSVRVGKGVRLHHVVSHGWLRGVASPVWLLLIWSVAVVSGLIVLGSGAYSEDVAQTGVAVALGGATGNLLDRLLRGHVVDFIGIGAWPVFNVADAGIVAGIGLAVMAALV